MPVARFEQLHDEAFQDSEFIEATTALGGGGPATTRWRDLGLQGTSVLEIGPGTGDLLAAAKASGRHVAAVETSKIHRDFIRERWGIESLYSELSQVPEECTFDAIIAINVLEHVYDIGQFLRAARRLLAPGGTFFVSTVNAAALEMTVLRSRWSMCKVHDHVSFPSPAGLALAARAAGFQAERIQTGGLPFEFVISSLTSVRDSIREVRKAGEIGRHDQVVDRTHTAEVGPAIEGGTAASMTLRANLARFYRVTAPHDPTSWLLGKFGRASSVKARLVC